MCIQCYNLKGVNTWMPEVDEKSLPGKEHLTG